MEEFGADIMATSNDVFPPCFHLAARHGQLHLVKYFVETRGGSVDEVDPHESKRTPLHFACMCRGDMEARVLPVVEYLLSKGASMTLKAGNGKNAHEMATEAGNLRIYHYLVAQQGRRATEGGGSGDRNTVFKDGATPDDDADDGLRLAILTAATKGNLTSVQRLIDDMQRRYPGYWQTARGISILRKVVATAAYAEKGASTVKLLCSKYGLPVYKWESEDCTTESEDVESHPHWPLMGAMTHRRRVGLGIACPPRAGRREAGLWLEDA